MHRHEPTDTPLNTCTLVWDGAGPPRVPAAMGTPRGDQLRGSPLDNLIELAGRVCYDSLGTKNSRNTDLYHDHINETGHHSTHEHANFTALVTVSGPNFGILCESLLNRPGVWVEYGNDGDRAQWGRPSLRVTLNMRTVRDWVRAGVPDLNRSNGFASELGRALAGHATALCPKACGDLVEYVGDGVTGIDCRMDAPASDSEVWVSMHFENVSRGLSHELVRHKYQTAVSQRSTRFVAESESQWVPHPLVLRRPALLAEFDDFAAVGGRLYDRLAHELETELKADPATAGNARKQARGAARGVLGNALETQLIFSASVAQWKWMIRTRTSMQADAEIRLAFNNVYALLSETFPARFAGWTTAPCEDGLGYEATGS